MATIDDLLSMSMEEIEDLPPMGTPPTGHYNLEVSASRNERDGGGEYVQFSYTVTSVNEVKDPTEENQVAVGMKFSEFFSPLKKDGTTNDVGMKFLKQTIMPYAVHFGAKSFEAALQTVDKVAIAATLVRRVDKKDPDRFNFSLKDVVIL